MSSGFGEMDVKGPTALKPGKNLENYATANTLPKLPSESPSTIKTYH